MPRVVVLDEKRRLLLVHHAGSVEGRHDRLWVLPGGDVEPGETSVDAARREVREETGIEVEILGLLWLVEELLDDGSLRAHPYFLGVPIGGSLRVGEDPELTPETQVIDDARYFERSQLRELDRIYPGIMREEFWRLLDAGAIRVERQADPIYRVRPCPGFGR